MGGKGTRCSGIARSGLEMKQKEYFYDMKRFLTVLTIAALSLLKAEAQQLFRDTISFPSSQMGGTNVSFSNDSAYFLGGYVFGPLGNVGNHGFLSKIARNGQILWSKMFYNAGFECEQFVIDKILLQKDNSSIIVLNGRCYTFPSYDLTTLINIDSAGNFNWIKAYSNNNGYLTKVLQTESGKIFSVGTDVIYPTSGQQSELFLTCFDTLGNFLWSKVFMAPNAIPTSPDFQLYPYGMIETKDKNLIICGGPSSSTGQNDPHDYAFLAKIDTNGNIIWVNEYKQSFHFFNAFKDLVELQSGNLLVFYTSGFGWNDPVEKYVLLKIDKDGNIIWGNEYSRDVQTYITGIGLESTEIYLYGIQDAYSGCISCRKGFLIVADTSGNIESIHAEGNNGLEYISNVLISDSTILFAGTFTADTVSFPDRLISCVESISKYGEFPCGSISSSFSVTSVSVNRFAFSFLPLNNYPASVTPNIITTGNYFLSHRRCYGIANPLGLIVAEQTQSGIYPNPTEGLLYVTGTTSGEKVIIENLMGQVVSEVTCENTKTEMNISELATGVYLLVLTNVNGFIIDREKIVKQ